MMGASANIPEDAAVVADSQMAAPICSCWVEASAKLAEGEGEPICSGQEFRREETWS